MTYQAQIEYVAPKHVAAVNTLAAIIFDALKPQLSNFIKSEVSKAIDDELATLDHNVEMEVDRAVNEALSEIDRTIEREVESQLDGVLESSEFEDSVKEVLRSSVSISVD